MNNVTGRDEQKAGRITLMYTSGQILLQFDRAGKGVIMFLSAA